nr:MULTISPECIES: adenosylcobinamide-GDP ribazoletransferase [unclassified Haladaptatus]
MTAFRGAVGFLSRAPVGQDKDSWNAFRSTPTSFPLAGYPIGLVLALPFVLPISGPFTAFAFVTLIYIVTGIPHADAIADLGDAAVVHGPPDERQTVMQDTTVGVGAVLALGLVLLGLWTVGLQLSSLTLGVLGLVVTAEVGAKLAMATIACLGTPAHEGLGSAVADDHGPRSLVLPIVAALPAAAFTWPNPAAAIGLVGAFAAALVMLAWASRRLGGVSGDVMGGANELARLAALLTGVIVWTHS